MSDQEMQKQMLKLWKMSIDSYLTTMDAISEQSQKMLELMLEQSDSVREEFKKTLRDWAANSKDLQDQYKDSLEQSVKKLEDMIGKG